MDFKTAVRDVFLTLVYIVILGIVVVEAINRETRSEIVLAACVVGLVVLTVVALVIERDSASRVARQSNRILKLASETVTHMRQGLNEESAQAVCDLLLPGVSACAVALTDTEKVLGYAGVEREYHKNGTPIQSSLTKETLLDGVTRAADNAAEIGFNVPEESKIKKGIVVPLILRSGIVGSLKFYYPWSIKVDESQIALVTGYAQLLSSQLGLYFLDEQTELATRMELRALQAQINPHFLFNTINCIASYTRTDPEKARKMLREFAVYYRRMLENSEDLIPLDNELEQTERYLMFQRARFGEDSVTLSLEIEEGLGELPVPAFIIQPLVENSVGHARRETGETLNIVVRAYRITNSVIISVSDDGVGIPPERLSNVVEGGSKTGMGIALKNIDARLHGYFGTDSGIHISSEYGKGTEVFLSLYDALADGEPGIEIQEEL